MKVVALLALVAAAFVAAGSARAAWCGETSDAACQTSMAYVECADGTIWLVDPALVDADAYAGFLCSGGYTVLQPPEQRPGPPPPPAGGPYDLDPGIAPDPALYVGEVRCPDGTIWAVARGDDFACP